MEFPEVRAPKLKKTVAVPAESAVQLPFPAKSAFGKLKLINWKQPTMGLGPGVPRPPGPSRQTGAKPSDNTPLTALYGEGFWIVALDHQCVPCEYNHEG